MSAEQKVERATYLILAYGGIDGAHHKQWLLDQLVRTLAGPEYDAWVSTYENGGDYEWDTGIAP